MILCEARERQSKNSGADVHRNIFMRVARFCVVKVSIKVHHCSQSRTPGVDYVCLANWCRNRKNKTVWPVGCKVEQLRPESKAEDDGKCNKILIVSFCCSLFWWTNETLNAWTHLLGWIYFAYFTVDEILQLVNSSGISTWQDSAISLLIVVCFQVCISRYIEL